MSSHPHKDDAPLTVSLGVISVSSSRTLEQDESGHWIGQTAMREGHQLLSHQLVPDDARTIRQTLRDTIRELRPDALIVTGGSGVGRLDVTIEAVQPMFTKELTAFGAIFANLSYQQVGAAATLSRATAGLVETTAVYCLPGSLKACKLACKRIIFPELRHLVRHLKKG
jgi:molybdenum cofactor biosynthesis protein B